MKGKALCRIAPRQEFVVGEWYDYDFFREAGKYKIYPSPTSNFIYLMNITTFNQYFVKP